MFFDQTLGGGSPAGLTSPGMNPSSLAALLAMSGGGLGSMMGSGAGAGAAGANPMPGPQLNPMAQRGGAPNPAGTAPQMPQQQSLLQMLMAMDPNKLKQLLGGMGLGGIGGVGGSAAPQPAATGMPMNLLSSIMPAQSPMGGTGGYY